MKFKRKQLRNVIIEVMKFNDDGRSMDQVARDIKIALATSQVPVVAPGETEVPDLSPITELPYYNAAQDKDIFMAGYNSGADDAAFDLAPDYSVEDGEDDPSTSLDDYATGYVLGYAAFSGN